MMRIEAADENFDCENYVPLLLIQFLLGSEDCAIHTVIIVMRVTRGASDKRTFR